MFLGSFLLSSTWEKALSIETTLPIFTAGAGIHPVAIDVQFDRLPVPLIVRFRWVAVGLLIVLGIGVGIAAGWRRVNGREQPVESGQNSQRQARRPRVKSHTTRHRRKAA